MTVTAHRPRTLGTQVVLVLRGRGGIRVSTHTDRGAALTALAAYARQWWPPQAVFVPRDDAEAVRLYFEQTPRESWSIDRTTTPAERNHQP